MHTENGSYLDCFVGQCRYHAYTVNIGGCICYTMYNCTLSRIETIGQHYLQQPVITTWTWESQAVPAATFWCSPSPLALCVWSAWTRDCWSCLRRSPCLRVYSTNAEICGGGADIPRSLNTTLPLVVTCAPARSMHPGTIDTSCGCVLDLNKWNMLMVLIWCRPIICRSCAELWESVECAVHIDLAHTHYL